MFKSGEIVRLYEFNIGFFFNDSSLDDRNGKYITGKNYLLILGKLRLRDYYYILDISTNQIGFIWIGLKFKQIFPVLGNPLF